MEHLKEPLRASKMLRDRELLALASRSGSSQAMSRAFNEVYKDLSRIEKAKGLGPIIL